MPEIRKKFMCARCRKSYKGWDGLRRHSKIHLNEAEISMLAEGHMPAQSKVGSEFKGKNRVIIS